MCKCLVFFLSLFLPLLAQTAINQEGDYQWWQKTIYKQKITDKTLFYIMNEYRLGDNCSKFYFTYLQANFDCAFTPNVVLSPGYRQIFKRSPLSSSHFEPEYSPLVDLIFKWPAASWNFMVRNRVQYLIFKSEQHWLYRNLVRIYTPWQFTSIKINPYVENECFWRQGKGINQERVAIGLKETFSKHISTDIYYLARFLKTSTGDWIYNNVFGFNLVIKY